MTGVQTGSEQTRSSSRLLNSGAGVVAGQAAQGIVSLVAAPIIISNAGAQIFGLYSAIISTQIVGALADLGTANTVLTEVPKALARGDVRGARSTVMYALKLASVLSLVVTMLAFLLYRFGDSVVGDLLNAPQDLAASAHLGVSAALLCVAGNLVGSVFFKLRQAQGFVGAAFLCQGFAAAIGGLATIAASYARLPVWVLILTTLGPPAVARIGLALPGLRSLRGCERTAADGPVGGSKPALGRLTLYFTYIQLVGVLAYSIDQLLLARLTNLGEVAEYALVSRVAAPATVVASAIGAVLWPEFGDAIQRRQGARVQAIVNRCLRVLVPGAVLCGAGLIVVGPFLWPVLGRGAVYPAAGLVVGFAGLILTRVIDNVTTPVLNAIPIIGMQVLCSSLLLLVNVGLTVVLSLRYGAAGAIWGTVVSQVPIVTVPYLIRARREIRSITPP